MGDLRCTTGTNGAARTRGGSRIPWVVSHQHFGLMGTVLDFQTVSSILTPANSYGTYVVVAQLTHITLSLVHRMGNPKFSLGRLTKRAPNPALFENPPSCPPVEPSVRISSRHYRTGRRCVLWNTCPRALLATLTRACTSSRYACSLLVSFSTVMTPVVSYSSTTAGLRRYTYVQSRLSTCVV